MSKILPLVIAMAAHAANQEVRAALGQKVVPWQHLDKDAQESILAGVRYIQEYVKDGYSPTPEQCHAAWMAKKVADGWKFGLIQSALDKTHPNLVAFDKLEEEEQAKDRLFLAIVLALSPECGGMSSWESGNHPI